MRCVLLKKPDDAKGLEIRVELRPGGEEADVIWPPGRPPAGVERLATSPWTRNHGYGYLRTPSGLMKIEAIEFDETSGQVRMLVLSPVGGRAAAKGQEKSE